MVDGSVLHLLLSGLLEFQLLIEREDGTLGRLMDVACSSTAAAEVGCALWETILEERCWSTSGAALGSLWGLEVVASSTSACMRVGIDVWVRLDE